MTLVMQTDVDWAYPVLAFLRDGEIRYFDDPLPLAEFPPWVFNDGVLHDMELIDSEGRRWFVRTVDRVSPGHPPRRWWQFWPFWVEPRDILALGLEEGGRVDFKVVRQRAYDLVEEEARRDDQLDDYRNILDDLRKAKDFREIGQLTGSLDAIGFLT